MKNDNLKLEKVIDFKKWNKLQDSIALVTKMAMVTVDYKGNPVTEHSGCQKFCSVVRQNKDMVKYCQKCDSRGGLEAARINKPYIYLCHYNIVDIAIPIIIDDKYIGAMMAGQIKLSKSSDNDMLEQITTVSSKNLIKNSLGDLKEYYESLPILSYDEVINIANMLFDLCNYLVEEALNKNLAIEMNENIIQNGVRLSKDIFAGYRAKSIENMKKEMSNIIINYYVEENESENSKISVSRTLRPAIDYVYNHKSENISAKDMANLCHISQSYFSRLFVKETGEKFSSYISRLKIGWAKSILEETDIPIVQISEELGFNEPGYFIKMFRKHEGVTPSVYRRYYKK
ncbi:MAG: PocR ligand-binding domain-containing protein [Romboutsia sp.]